MKKIKILFLTIIISIMLTGCSEVLEEEQTGSTIKSTTITKSTVIASTKKNDNTQKKENNTKKSNKKIKASKKEKNTNTTGKVCRIDILDVGQGSSTLVECDNQYMLVDGGDSATSSYVVSYLKKRGVKTLKYAIATHYDSDHLNGIVGALNVFKVKNVFGPDYTETTRVYNSFINITRNNNLFVKSPKVGNKYKLGHGTFTIVAPNRNYSDVNDNSIGIRFSYYNNSFIVCGDASADSEQDMIHNNQTLKSDVYIVNHHGSSHSTTTTFLNRVNPKYAVISSGTGNSYGHPSKQTLARLLNKNIDIYRTDKEKEIIIKMDGKKITFNHKPYNKLEPGYRGGTSNKKGNNTNTNKNIASLSKDTKNANYILNASTKKIHKPGCSMINRMSEKNKIYYKGKIKDILEQGYDKCKACLGY